MIIEFAHTEDFKELNVLAKQVHALHVKFRPDIFKPMEFPLSKEDFLLHVQDETILVLRDNGMILGYALFHIIVREVPFVQKKLWVDVLCTREEFRDTGVGTALMERLKALGKSRGCSSIALTVSCENFKAISFYQSYGMRAENIRYSMTL